MSSERETTYRGLSEALQDTFVRQHTGALSCRVGNRREVFFMMSGVLYLSGTNPCRDRLETVLAGPVHSGEDPHFDPRAYLSRELSGVVEELSATLASWRVEDVRLREGLEDVPDDLVGPIPTAELVMDLVTRGVTFDGMLRRLGGAEASYRTFADYRVRRRVPYLRADELGLLERLEKRETVQRLIAEATDASNAVRQLTRLVSVGLIEAVDETSRLPGSTPEDVLAGVSESVATDLDAHPLRLEPELHRAQVETMLSSYGRLDYYQLLGVGSNTSAKEVHEAFMGLARLAHPCHAASLGLESSRPQLERLMVRLAEAYLALSDTEEAAEYRDGRGILKSPSEPEVETESSERRAEREEVARQSYRAALDCIEANDYFYAIQLLERATRADPRPEYYVMLGHCQRKNPKWLHMAVDSFRRAVALSPADEELKVYLSEAKQEYREHREALEAEPEPEPEPEDPIESRDERRARRALSKLWPRS